MISKYWNQNGIGSLPDDFSATQKVVVWAQDYMGSVLVKWKEHLVHTDALPVNSNGVAHIYDVYTVQERVL